jgi:predicted enzyme related to lactoylglutathione lyase
MLGLKRIDNMDILCKDFLAVVDFYHRNLELPFFLPYSPEKGWAAIDAGNLTIYIFKTDVGTHAPTRTPINEENPPGIDSIAWEVDDLDATIQALEGRVEWASDEIISWHHESGTWYRYRPFYDPEGNMLYVTEPHKVAAASE